MLCIILLTGLNTNRFFTRFDITENKIFSISEVSKSLFTEIPDRVSITYYVSEKLEKVTPIPDEVRNILYEYAAFSRGKISVTMVDPVESGRIAEVENLGIVPQNIRVVEENEERFTTVYTGIVIRYLDRFETIPLIFSVETLEYELTSKIRGLLQQDDRSVGLLSGNASFTVEENYSYVRQYLSRNFSVRTVLPGREVPFDIDVLFVFGVKDLDEADAFFIDQYIMSGGRVFFALDAVYVDIQRNLAASEISDAPVITMVKQYGISVEPKLVLDVHHLQFPLDRRRGNITVRSLEDYPHWVVISEDTVNRENLLTARFSGLNLFWSSPLHIMERDGTSFEELIYSSPQSWTMESYLTTNPHEAVLYENPDKNTQRPYLLCAALRGSFSSLFTAEDAERLAGADYGSFRDGIPDGRMVVIGDADFSRDIFQQFVHNRADGSNYNMEFLFDAAEWLSNNEDLLEIRTRAHRNMRLDRIKNPVSRQAAVFFIHFINIFLIPFLVVVFGIIRALRRRETVPAGTDKNTRDASKGEDGGRNP
jgi:gliding-associated putative ABC transporter substrate-binding component GldG